MDLAIGSFSKTNVSMETLYSMIIVGPCIRVYCNNESNMNDGWLHYHRVSIYLEDH